MMNIQIIRKKAAPSEIKEMLKTLDSYVKLAVDIKRKVVAGGGVLHADCEPRSTALQPGLPDFALRVFSAHSSPGLHPGLPVERGEAVLLEDGSKQNDIWGADWLPDSKEVRFEALINIRPKQNNRSMVIENETIRLKVEKIVREKLEI